MSMLLRRYHENNTNIKAEGATEKVAPKPTQEEKAQKVKEAEKELTLTAKDIKLMNGTKLRKLAKQYGIENPEELTVGELKAILCGKIG